MANEFSRGAFIKYLADNPDQRLGQAIVNFYDAKAVWKQMSGEASDINDPRLKDIYEE